MIRGYRIVDEPRPSGLARWTVQPLWPFLAVMLGGAVVAWPWFAVNAYALGSPTRVRETLWAAGGFLGNVLLTWGLFELAELTRMTPLGARYAVVGLVVWKLAISYRLYLLQGRTFSLYRYFGGTVRNGVVVVIAAFFLSARVLVNLPTFWFLVLR